jgi:hypothetical protein
MKVEIQIPQILQASVEYPGVRQAEWLELDVDDSYES